MDGAVGLIVAPRGHLRVVLKPVVVGSKIVAIDAILDPDSLRAIRPADLDGRRSVPGCPPRTWRGASSAQPPATIRATASNRASVPASAWPVTASGRQCRWNARSTEASAGSKAPSGATR